MDDQRGGVVKWTDSYLVKTEHLSKIAISIVTSFDWCRTCWTWDTDRWTPRRWGLPSKKLPGGKLRGHFVTCDIVHHGITYRSSRTIPNPEWTQLELGLRVGSWPNPTAGCFDDEPLISNFKVGHFFKFICHLRLRIAYSTVCFLLICDG